MARHHLALLSLLLAVGLAFVGVASAAASSTPTPTHAGKKGGKGKATCPPSSCNLATDAELQVVTEALDKIVTAQQGTYAPLKATLVVDSTATADSPPVCTTGGAFGGDAPPGWGVGCLASPVNFLPQSMEMGVSCPPEYFELKGFICKAYVANAEGVPIKTLAIVSSGTFSRWLTCVASLDGLPDGTIVSIEAGVTCSGYVAPPPTGVGAKTASAVDAAVSETLAKLRAQAEQLEASSPPARALAAKMAGGGN